MYVEVIVCDIRVVFLGGQCVYICLIMDIYLRLCVCLFLVLDVAAFERVLGPRMDIYLRLCVCLFLVLDVAAFERVLGPCMDTYLRLCVCVSLVLDVAAFERVLGPCMDIMKRNIDAYEEQLVNIFGSKAAITDLR